MVGKTDLSVLKDVLIPKNVSRGERKLVGGEEEQNVLENLPPDVDSVTSSDWLLSGQCIK